MPVVPDLRTGDLEQIYYVDARDLRDTRVISSEGKVVMEAPGGGDLCRDPGGTGGCHTGLRTPLVVAVKDGEVSGSHLSTVDSQLNSFETLTTAQRNELSALYACLFARAS